MKHIDIAVANAGVSQECDYFEDTFDSKGDVEEPRYAVVEVNYRAVLNFVKLSLSTFRKQVPGSSLVITSSATAYLLEQSLPVYSATKTAVRSLVSPSHTFLNSPPIFNLSLLASFVLFANPFISMAQRSMPLLLRQPSQSFSLQILLHPS